jgi:hypothetical protein
MRQARGWAVKLAHDEALSGKRALRGGELIASHGKRLTPEVDLA